MYQITTQASIDRACRRNTVQYEVQQQPPHNARRVRRKPGSASNAPPNFLTIYHPHMLHPDQTTRRASDAPPVNEHPHYYSSQPSFDAVFGGTAPGTLPVSNLRELCERRRSHSTSPRGRTSQAYASGACEDNVCNQRSQAYNETHFSSQPVPLPGQQQARIGGLKRYNPTYLSNDSNDAPDTLNPAQQQRRRGSSYIPQEHVPTTQPTPPTRRRLPAVPGLGGNVAALLDDDQAYITQPQPGITQDEPCAASETASLQIRRNSDYNNCSTHKRVLPTPPGSIDAPAPCNTDACRLQNISLTQQRQQSAQPLVSLPLPVTLLEPPKSVSSPSSGDTTDTTTTTDDEASVGENNEINRAFTAHKERGDDSQACLPRTGLNELWPGAESSVSSSSVQCHDYVAVAELSFDTHTPHSYSSSVPCAVIRLQRTASNRSVDELIDDEQEGMESLGVPGEGEYTRLCRRRGSDQTEIIVTKSSETSSINPSPNRSRRVSVANIFGMGKERMSRSRTPPDADSEFRIPQRYNSARRASYAALVPSGSASQLSDFGDPNLSPSHLDLPEGSRRSSAISLYATPGSLGSLEFGVQYFPIRQRLRVTLYRAERLSGTIRPEIELNSYVKVCLMPGKLQKQHSRVVKRTRDAVFNEEFFFDAITNDELRKRWLRLKFYHREEKQLKQLQKDYVIGEIELDFFEIIGLNTKKEIRITRDLQPKYNTKTLGRVQFGLCIEQRYQRLTINVIKIYDLPKFGISGTPDPCVRITVDQDTEVQTKSTRVLKHCCNAAFRESVMFLIDTSRRGIENTTVTVSVVDTARLGCGLDIIGSVFLGAQGNSQAEVEQWQCAWDNDGREVKCTHELSAPCGQ